MPDNVNSVDLSSYAASILTDDDKPLFDDAVRAGKAGALRAAYVMIWLACAESLKRRFQEAQKRDSAASKIVKKIEAKELAHKAVDSFVLDKAKEYGFVPDSGHTILEHVYKMRCIYGHPYEEAPSEAQLTHAADAVVELVLSKPVTLRHGFGTQLLKNLLEKQSYLDDQLVSVKAFTKDILPRIDESIHGWLLDNYLEKLEPIADDSSVLVFFRRGIWFCRTMLTEIGVEIFSHDDWHERIGRFPKTLMRLCRRASIFENIGKRAQDSLVGAILEESDTRASVLIHLEHLKKKNVLSKRHRQRFSKHLSEMKSDELFSAGLSTEACYDKLITAMKSHNWYTQNPAIDLIMSNGPDQAARLNKGQRVNLGRNILQARDGNAASAATFLENLWENAEAWPYEVILGIVLESFTNEKNMIRFKDRYLDDVLDLVDRLNQKRWKQLVAQVVASIDKGTPKSWVDLEDFDRVIAILEPYSWSAPLVESLHAKSADLLPEDKE